MNDKKTKPQFISVPFSGSSPNGMVEYNGIAKFSLAGIVVEYDSKYLGLVGGEVKEVRISLDEILDIRFRKGFYKFFAQIQFRLRNFATVSELPNTGGKVKLNIKREDHERARKAVEQISQYLSEDEPPFLQEGDEANGQLPPARTSVNELFDTEKLQTKDSRKTRKL